MHVNVVTNIASRGNDRDDVVEDSLMVDEQAELTAAVVIGGRHQAYHR